MQKETRIVPTRLLCDLRRNIDNASIVELLSLQKQLASVSGVSISPECMQQASGTHILINQHA